MFHFIGANHDRDPVSMGDGRKNKNALRCGEASRQDRGGCCLRSCHLRNEKVKQNEVKCDLQYATDWERLVKEMFRAGRAVLGANDSNRDNEATMPSNNA